MKFAAPGARHLTKGGKGYGKPDVDERNFQDG
jgi:hypothetical protein